MDLQEDEPTQSQAVSLEDRVKLLAEQTAVQHNTSLVRALLLSHGHGAAQVRQSVTMMHSFVQACFPQLLDSKMRLMTKLVCEDQILAKPGGCTILKDEGYTAGDLVALLKLPIAKNGIEIGPGCFIAFSLRQRRGRSPATWYWLMLDYPSKYIVFSFVHNDNSSEDSNVVSVLARFFLWSRYLNPSGRFEIHEILRTTVDHRERDILRRSLCLCFSWISEQSHLWDVPFDLYIVARCLEESSRLTDVICTKSKQVTGIRLETYLQTSSPEDQKVSEIDVIKRFLSELPNLETLHISLSTDSWTSDEMDPLKPFFTKNYTLTDFKCFGDAPWMRRCMQRNKRIGGKYFVKIDQLAKDIVKEENDKLLQALICSPRARKIQSPAPMYAIVHTCFPQMLPSLPASSGIKLQAGMKRRREE